MHAGDILVLMPHTRLYQPYVSTTRFCCTNSRTTTVRCLGRVTLTRHNHRLDWLSHHAMQLLAFRQRVLQV